MPLERRVCWARYSKRLFHFKRRKKRKSN